MEGGISSGHYYIDAINTTYNGNTYNTYTAFDNAFWSWNYLTVADLDLGTFSGSKIAAFTADLDDPDLFGWATFYIDGTLINNGNRPDQNWDHARVAMNLYALDNWGLTSSDEHNWLAAHEVGHALGLDHHTDFASVMDDTFYTNTAEHKGVQNGWNYPQQDDEDGVQYLYD
jgi:hypothetical protein